MNFKKFSYALITAARNEEETIGACIESTLDQTVLPVFWVIISDGSTDNTELIIEKYAKNNNFIRLIKRKKDNAEKGFSSKVNALNIGANLLINEPYEYIGHLDADITLEKEYYYKVIIQFQNNHRLGTSGGYIFERDKGVFKSRSSNSPWSVAGGIQLFRRKCYLDVMPMKPIALGGEDWYSEIKARMRGWEVKSFHNIIAYHHRHSSARRGLVKEGLRNGILHYVIGSHPIFEMVKIIRRIKEKPFFVLSMLIFYGYIIAFLTRKKIEVSDDVVEFLQKEQIYKVKNMLKEMVLLRLSCRKPDRFSV